MKSPSITRDSSHAARVEGVQRRVVEELDGLYTTSYGRALLLNPERDTVVSLRPNLHRLKSEIERDRREAKLASRLRIAAPVGWLLFSVVFLTIAGSWSFPIGSLLMVTTMVFYLIFDHAARSSKHRLFALELLQLTDEPSGAATRPERARQAPEVR